MLGDPIFSAPDPALTEAPRPIQTEESKKEKETGLKVSCVGPLVRGQARDTTRGADMQHHRCMSTIATQERSRDAGMRNACIESLYHLYDRDQKEIICRKTDRNGTTRCDAMRTFNTVESLYRPYHHGQTGFRTRRCYWEGDAHVTRNVKEEAPEVRESRTNDNTCRMEGSKSRCKKKKAVGIAGRFLRLYISYISPRPRNQSIQSVVLQ